MALTVPGLQRHVEVGEGLLAVVQGHGELGEATATLVAGPDGGGVIDTLLCPQMAHGIADAARRRGVVVREVLNTHHHVDHVGGNSVFSDATVIAHPTTSAIVDVMGRQPESYRTIAPSYRDELAELTLVTPRLLGDQRSFGGGRIIVEHGHSAADLAVWFAASQTLVTGDLATNEVVPLTVQGHLQNWIAALDRLRELGALTVVPGHGLPGDGDLLSATHRYLSNVLTAAATALAADAGDPRAARAAFAELDAGQSVGWQEPRRTEINLARALGELAHRPDPAAVGAVRAAR